MLIIDGIVYEPTGEEREVVRIEMWYDRSLRLWTLYPVDVEGNQIAGADYAYGKPAAIKRRAELEAEWNLGA